jgi:hypothetical protein
VSVNNLPKIIISVVRVESCCGKLQPFILLSLKTLINRLKLKK